VEGGEKAAGATHQSRYPSAATGQAAKIEQDHNSGPFVRKQRAMHFGIDHEVVAAAPALEA